MEEINMNEEWENSSQVTPFRGTAYENVRFRTAAPSPVWLEIRARLKDCEAVEEMLEEIHKQRQSSEFVRLSVILHGFNQSRVLITGCDESALSFTFANLDAGFVGLIHFKGQNGWGIHT